MEERGKQSGMENGRVPSAQHVFIGTSGPGWSVLGGEDDLSFRGAVRCVRACDLG